MRFDTVVIGGGWHGMRKALEACRAGKSCAMISVGRSIDKVDYNEFVAIGGILMLGDRVVGGCIEDDGSGCLRVSYVTTEKLLDTPIGAENFVLATGRFFSGGLVADMDSLREAVFGFDTDSVVSRAEWFSEDFFAPQPFLSFGVKVDDCGHPFKDGVPVTNVVAVGDVVSGF